MKDLWLLAQVEETNSVYMVRLDKQVFCDLSVDQAIFSFLHLELSPYNPKSCCRFDCVERCRSLRLDADYEYFMFAVDHIRINGSIRPSPTRKQ
jgi:hypothetical protein